MEPGNVRVAGCYLPSEFSFLRRTTIEDAGTSYAVLLSPCSVDSLIAPSRFRISSLILLQRIFRFEWKMRWIDDLLCRMPFVLLGPKVRGIHSSGKVAFRFSFVHV